ncbi:MAG TPA: Gldg family protein [Candidatus Omnitrophota bacterium]|nr:Gldg family protein [Candidatus Omnitrophota bacterium]HPS37566.1 Gldg family protein [Candidatus Omnitrophota bacterium]
MRQFLLKFQMLFEALILLATLGMVYFLISNYHYRWDLTREKVYSLPPATADVLRGLKGQRLEVVLFYLQEDPVKQGLEVFLKECQRYHPDFHYDFFDPNRRPRIAQQFNVREPSVILVRVGEREERLTRPSEEDFTNAFLRLLHPKDLDVCFVTGHGEAELFGEDPNGIQKFRDTLEGYNAMLHEIVLSRDHVPDTCQVVTLAGPRWELKPEELADIRKAFENGKGVLLMFDPMDPGTGASFEEFTKQFGVVMGNNVLVDKKSRIVGGDFLMPLVSQYYVDHPVTRTIKEATFFPLVRTIQPSTEGPAGLEVTPLAMTSDESWAETDLPQLEKGNAIFDMKTDVAGPLPVLVAVEQKQADGKRKAEDEKPGASPSTLPHSAPNVSQGGRMLIVGDSDFLSNGYLNLSGNKELGLNMIRWLARDDRFVDVRRAELRFSPILMNAAQRTKFLIVVLAVFPLTFLLLGGLYLVIRLRTS